MVVTTIVLYSRIECVTAIPDDTASTSRSEGEAGRSPNGVLLAPPPQPSHESASTTSWLPSWNTHEAEGIRRDISYNSLNSIPTWKQIRTVHVKLIYYTTLKRLATILVFCLITYYITLRVCMHSQGEVYA